MRVFFINLDRAPERRAHMEEALRGADFERVAAVDGRSLPPPPKSLTPIELACIESHRLVWRKFLATPAPFACVLEDDVHLSADFFRLIKDETWIPADAHAVKLDTFFNPVMLGPDLRALPERRLARLYTRHESSAAYVVSRRGAEYYLRVTETPEAPADYTIFPVDPAGAGLVVYQLAPAVVIQDVLYQRARDGGKNFQSEIGKLGAVKPKGGIGMLTYKIKRESRRLYGQIFQAKRYLTNRFVRGLRPEIVPYL